MTASISVIIPCHNAAARLEQTLAHIAAQRVRPGLQWEVIVVDNASTDGTGEVALACWPADAPVSLRVVREPELGLRYAHLRGFAESRHDLICFVEDDNWIYPDYLERAVAIMQQHPEVGACGGLSEAVCETTPPAWFERFRHCYAVGAQGSGAGDITWSRGWLWGAGLTFRRAAWHALADRGFQPLLVDRRGKQLNSGGDVELCLALRLAGWRLWYDPGLRFRHFLQSHRLEWGYLRRLTYGCGVADVACDLYRFAAPRGGVSFTVRLRSTWAYQVVVAVLRLLRNPVKLLLAQHCGLEGDAAAFHNEFKLGRLSALLAWRTRYGRTLSDIRERLSTSAVLVRREPARSDRLCGAGA